MQTMLRLCMNAATMLYVISKMRNKLLFYQNAYASSQDISVKEKLHFMINVLLNPEGDIRDVVAVSITKKDTISLADQSQRYRFFKEKAIADKTKADQAIVKNELNRSKRMS